MGGHCERKSVRCFRGREGTWNLGLRYAVTGAFSAVPVVCGGGPITESPVTPETCPTLHLSSLCLLLPYFGPVIELFSSRFKGEHEGPQRIHLPCTD